MPFFSLPTGASPVLSGSTAPTGGVGNVGDLYIDREGRMLYGPKDAVSGWPTGITLQITGPTGPQVTGPTGAASTVTGPTGAASTVTGPTGATGAQSTVTGPTGPASTVTGPTGPASTVTGPTGPSGGPTGPTGPDPRGGINVQDATGTIDLNETAPRYQFINAFDDDRTLKLPTGVATGFDLHIKETGANYTLTVETTTATGVTTLGGGFYAASAIVVWDGSVWRVI